MTGRAPTRSRDLVVACALAALGLVVSLVSPGGWLQVVTLTPLVLVVPGYALAAAFFPPGFVTRDERAVLTVSFSVGAWALGGLLTQLVVGLDRVAWILLAVSITTVASAVAQARRDGLSTSPTAPVRLGGPLPAAAAYLAAIAIAGLAVAIAAGGQSRQLSSSHFSVLWLLPQGPPSGYAGDHPATQPVVVGARSHEDRALTYRLQVTRNGRTVSQWELRLKPGQRWQARLPGPAIAGGGPLVASLFRDGALYRRVALKARGTP